jgi:hypothetical protein
MTSLAVKPNPCPNALPLPRLSGLKNRQKVRAGGFHNGIILSLLVLLFLVIAFVILASIFHIIA